MGNKQFAGFSSKNLPVYIFVAEHPTYSWRAHTVCPVTVAKTLSCWLVPVFIQGKSVSVWFSLVAPLRPAQHSALPLALLSHNPCYHRKHYGQVQRHSASWKLKGQWPSKPFYNCPAELRHIRMQNKTESAFLCCFSEVEFF